MLLISISSRSNTTERNTSAAHSCRVASRAPSADSRARITQSSDACHSSGSPAPTASSGNTSPAPWCSRGTPSSAWDTPSGPSPKPPAVANAREDFFRTVTTTVELLEWLRQEAPQTRLVAGVECGRVRRARHAGPSAEAALLRPYSPYALHKLIRASRGVPWSSVPDIPLPHIPVPHIPLPHINAASSNDCQSTTTAASSSDSNSPSAMAPLTSDLRSRRGVSGRVQHHEPATER